MTLEESLPVPEAHHKEDVMEHTGFLVGSLGLYTGRGALHIPLLPSVEAVRGINEFSLLKIKGGL
jgi:hypothetical protein